MEEKEEEEKEAEKKEEVCEGLECLARSDMTDGGGGGERVTAR